MKNLIFTLLSIVISICSNNLFGQTISTVWTKKMGSTSNESILAIKTDLSGNQYVAGYFSGTVDFDPGAGVTNLTSAGSYDIFIAKYDSEGSLVWAKRIGSSTGNDVAWGLALDASNNVHVTGYFNGAADFDPGAGTSNMSSAGLDIFVLKLDANGNFVWSRKMGGADLDQAYDIAVDGSGNVYTTGYFTNSADFDPGAGSTVLTVGSLSVEAAFISVLNSSGNFVAAKQITGTDAFTRGLRIRLDASTNVYLCGYFGGTVDFDPNAGTFNMTSTGSENAYVMKLNSSLNYVWAKRTGGTAETRANGMDLDGSGNVIVTGQYIGTVDFDPGAGTTNLTSVNSNDIYVQKLDASGNFSWARSMGGTMDNYGFAVKVDQNNEIYVAGQFSGTVDFDPGAGTNNLSATGSFDLFVTKLNSSGNFILARKIGGSGVDYLNNITTLGTSQVFIGGYFEGTVDFDINAGVSNLSSSGARDIFLTKWDFCTMAPSTPGSISGSSSLCAGSSSAYSVTAVTGATTYNWTLPAGWSGASTNTSITGTSGSSGTITLSASNGCGTSGSASFPVTVLTIPSTPGTISGNANVCLGSSSAYSVSSVPGATSYVWTLPVGWTGSSTTATINGTVNSSGTITVAASNTCGTSGVSSFPVSILTAPSTPGSISGNTTVCSATSENYTIANVPGATSYNWTMPAGWSGSSSTTAISSIAGSSGTITVSASNACGTSGTASLPITVNAIPSSPAMINGINPICEGVSTAYAVAPVSGANSYSWTLPAGWSGTSTTETMVATAGSTGGVITVLASNQCGSSTAATMSVTVNQIPTISGSDVTICAGESANLSASTNFGTIEWFNVPTGGTSLGSGTSYTTGALTNSTTYYVQGNNNSCLNNPRFAINVNVNQLPTITGNDVTICAGESATLTASTNLGTIEWFNVPTGGTSLGSGTSFTTGALTNSTTYYVQGNNNSCMNNPRFAINVNVNQLPTITGNGVTICAGESANLSASTNLGTIEWFNTPTGGTSLGSGTSFTTGVLTNSTTFYVEGNNNSCVNDPRFAVNVNVNQLPTITGNDVSICIGESANLTASTNFGTIEWFNTPTGGTSLGSGTSFTTGALTSSTTFYVEGNNNSCVNDPRFAINVNVNQVPTITGNDVTICAGESANLSASTDLGTIEWFSTPTGGTSLGSGNSFTTAVLTSSTTFYVQGNNNACLNDPRFAVNVTVNPSPTVATSFSGGIFTSQQANATSYQWIDCDNSNAAIPNETAQIFVPTQIGSYAVVVDLNGCVDTSACEIVTSIGLDEGSLSTITLYPNPSSTHFTVKSEKGISSISVYSVRGELVQQVAFSGVTQAELQPNVNPGVYMVNVIDSEKNQHILQWIKL